MNAHPAIKGIHHITAIASSAAENLVFYRQVLGLRLVKRTVNFDDPYTYHLYYGDEDGSPGTIITFFPWANLPPGRPGAGMVTSIAFAVPCRSLDFWRDRLGRHIPVTAGETRFGAPVLPFKDPHGLDLELVGVDSAPGSRPWTKGPIPEAHAITGFHSATARVQGLDPTRRLLTETMGMVPAGRQGNRFRFRMADGRVPGSVYDLLVDAQASAGRLGGGSVHHIAFRTPSGGEQRLWRAVLGDKGFSVTPVRDRKYFQSIYFSEPGGVLFEIATDSPGFDIDETKEGLGRTLTLPAQYEPIRAQIEAHLPPLRRDPAEAAPAAGAPG